MRFSAPTPIIGNCSRTCGCGWTGPTGPAGRTRASIWWRRAGTGALWAIQCKFWDHPVSKGDLDSFFTESGKHPFAARLVVATADLTPHAQAAFRDQQVPVHTLTLADLDHSPVDWAEVAWPAPDALPLRPRHAARPHQVAALDAVVAGFATADRGHVPMRRVVAFSTKDVAKRTTPPRTYILQVCFAPFLHERHSPRVASRPSTGV